MGARVKSSCTTLHSEPEITVDTLLLLCDKGAKKERVECGYLEEIVPIDWPQPNQPPPLPG